MKTQTSLAKALLVGAITLFTTHLANAQTILSDGLTNDTDITSGGYFFSQVVPTAGGSEADLFSYTASPYVASVTPDNSPYNGVSGDSTITVKGTSYYTGTYYTTRGTSTFQPVATINLSDSSPGTPISAFSLGILTGSTGTDSENDDLYELTLYSSGGTPLATTQLNTVPDEANPTTDDFLNATVSGAVTGDTLVVSAARNPDMNTDGSYKFGSNIVFSGVTFSSVSTPEPSTWALMLAGLGVLTALTLRRRQA